MHELGIVVHIIRTVEDIAKENNAKKVGKVVLEIGQVSGIVHRYLTDCWKWSVKKTEILQDCELVIEPIEAFTLCEDCHALYSTVKYAKICPECQSENTYLYCGNEMNIKEIEVLE